MLYVAIIVVKCPAAWGYPTLYREDLVLISAGSIEDARDQAAGHRPARCDATGESVWQLKHVVDVAPAWQPDVARGGPLYARHFLDYDAYRAFEPLLSGPMDGV